MDMRRIADIRVTQRPIFLSVCGGSWLSIHMHRDLLRITTFATTHELDSVFRFLLPLASEASTTLLSTICCLGSRRTYPNSNPSRDQALAHLQALHAWPTNSKQADCRAHLGCCIRRLPTPSLPPPRLHADVRRRSFGPAWGRTGVGVSLPSGSPRATVRVGTEPAWGRSRFIGTVASLDPRSRPTKDRDPRSHQVSQAGSVYPCKHGGVRPALPTVATTAAAMSPSPPLSPRRSQLSPAQRPHRPVTSPRPAPPRPSPPPRRLPPSRANGELSPWRTLRPDTVNHHLVCRPDTAAELQAIVAGT